MAEGKTTREAMEAVRSLLTLWALKYSLLLAGSKSTIDMAGVCGIGGGRQGVVGSDVLLNRLTTVGGQLARSPLKVVQTEAVLWRNDAIKIFTNLLPLRSLSCKSKEICQ